MRFAVVGGGGLRFAVVCGGGWGSQRFFVTQMLGEKGCIGLMGSRKLVMFLRNACVCIVFSCTTPICLFTRYRAEFFSNQNKKWRYTARLLCAFERIAIKYLGVKWGWHAVDG